MFGKSALLFFSLLLLSSQSFAQSQAVAANGTPIDLLGRDTVRVLNTAVPFLMISPDARSGAMGDAGAAISPDANSSSWNAAKLPFAKSDYGFSVSYTPWLRKLINDMSISYLTGYTKIRKQEAISFSLLYFNLGSIQFTDQNGAPIKDFRPQEFAFSGTYSRKLSERLGIGMGMKFIHSNLSGNVAVDNSGTTAKSGNAFAVNMNFYYISKEFMPSRSLPYKSTLALGGGIYNFGNRMTYTNANQRNYIPIDMKIGAALTTKFDEFNKLTLTCDLNKLMVPTPPVYLPASDGSDSINAAGNKTIVRGKDPNRSLLNGAFSSFADAPDGLKEELKEIMISTGAEYWYNDILAVRGGFFYENKLKGNRKYFTLGFGLRYNTFGIDFAYLVPLKQNNPLAETLRFSLVFNLQSKKTLKDIRS